MKLRRGGASAPASDPRGVRVIVVIGAGVAGLAAAGTLSRAGRSVVVLDKGRGVGGRCATRRLDGQAVDHGVSWFHGSDPAFLRAFEGFAPDEIVDGWPRRVVGSGPACNPRSLDPGGRRFALTAGASAFPKRLAQGLDVRLGARVVGLSRQGATLQVATDGGPTLDAEHVVLALPTEQASEVLAGLEPDRDVAAARFVLGRAGSVACLTVMALYEAGTPDPGFDVCLPDVGGPLALVSHDSTKRRAPARRALVLQATPLWSRAHLEEDAATWAASLRDAAAAQVGEWVRAPVLEETHRWRYARVDPVYALRGPLLLGSRGARIALTGEAFHDGSGVQGAFLAGQRAAERLLEVR